MIWVLVTPQDSSFGPWIFQDTNYVVDDFGNMIYLSDDQFEQAEDHCNNNGNGGFYDDEWEVKW